eukprot:gb/GFBE01046031.1/.p1 GENE.gb/GFBE01046031.1/~~gb/GFBE01046031.1/.p1  ORF type:complete len:242 (+),score=52.99 gb/GFBE01046031.1/:1-726(+)
MGGGDSASGAEAPPAVLKEAWVKRIVPGKPVRLPRLADTALRLTAIVLDMDGASAAKDGQEEVAELQLMRPPRKGESEQDASECRRLTLSRLKVRSVEQKPMARLKALLNCAEGSRLVAVGGTLLVLGRLEGALRPLPEEETAAKPPKAKTASGPSRPKNLDEFFEQVEAHLRVNGRTTLRRLGTALPLPPGVPTGRLKRMLLQRRGKFMVDLQGCVDINHSRRWRWQSQGLVTKRRKVSK